MFRLFHDNNIDFLRHKALYKKELKAQKAGA